eukprot:781358_1
MSTHSKQITHLDNGVNIDNSTFEVVEKDDVTINEEVNNEVNNEINNEISISNLSSIAPNALFNSFPKEYIDALIRRLNENKNTNTNNNGTNNYNESKENINNNNVINSNNSIDKLKNIGGTLAQQIHSLFDTT